MRTGQSVAGTLGWAGLAAGSVAVAARLAKRRQRRTLQVHGLGGPVTIQRNSFGVPHIIAECRDDALFGLGYAMASDRLWQMDLIRRKSLGRLAEVAGEAVLESDRLMRVFGMAQATSASAQAMSDDTRAATDALAAGINHWTATHRLPLEFRVSRHQPEPWTVSDTVAVLRLLAWTLGGSFFMGDVLAERFRSAIGDEWTDAIFSGRAAEAPPVIREHAGPAFVATESESIPALFPGHGFSNVWAVSGERSVTGFPLLAFDPHLEYTNPSIWYEASMEAPGYHVAGMTPAGYPGIGAGRNLHVAWGETAGMIGQAFLYREELNEAGDAVRDGDDWAQLKVRDELIGVRNREPETLHLRYTPRGPLISDLFPDVLESPFSLYWTGMETSHEAEALLKINAARSVDDILAVRDLHSVPTLNVGIASADGEIAQISVGRIPVRQPRAGLLDRTEFPPRYIPTEAMPYERNPSRGWVASANSRIVDDEYPYPMFGIWEPPFRMRRISDVLESRSKHSVADTRALQLDWFSIHSSELAPVLVELLDGHAPEWALDDLRSWKFQARPDSRATLLFQSFYHHWLTVSLAHQLPNDLVEAMAFSGSGGSVPQDFCDRLLLGMYPAWFGDDARRVLARTAFDEALAWLRNTLGHDHSDWTWGDMNQVRFIHPLGLLRGPHQRRLNVGPFPLGGDRTTVWPVVWNRRQPFQVGGGPSMRLVADLRRPGLTWGTNTLGVSGSPSSRHFRDQIGDFLNGRLHPIWPAGDKCRRAKILRPKNS
ncbi:penicillin acylase family protein [soil metagenome]